MRQTTVFLAIAATFVSSLAQAAVPERMHYQGYLTNADGEAVRCPDAVSCPDQSFTITFRLYDSAEGGAPTWVETHEGVAVVRGTFDVALGTASALDPADVTDPAWLGVEINGAGEMAPRQRLVSSAFALTAGNAESADLASLADDADRLGGLDAAAAAKPPESATDPEPDAAPDAAPAAAQDNAVTEHLAAVAKALRDLTTTVQTQHQRIAQVEKRFGMPNSARSDERPKPNPAPVTGWPMDMNNPMDRESVDKSVSFHDL